MKKQKIYLDTSIISYLFADDTPEKKADTEKLWEILKIEKYEIFLSERVLSELVNCSEPKKNLMIKRLGEISYETLVMSSEVEMLTKAYLKNNVLSAKSTSDCEHIAFAVVAGCGIIVSWNFKHLVNLKTINGVRFVNSVNNYAEIAIVSPSMILEEV